MTNLWWHAEPTKDPTVDPIVDPIVDPTIDPTVCATPLGQAGQFGNDLKLVSDYFNLSLRPFVSSCIWSCPCWLIIATRFWKLGLPRLRISPPSLLLFPLLIPLSAVLWKWTRKSPKLAKGWSIVIDTLRNRAKQANPCTPTYRTPSRRCWWWTSSCW